ncbi:MAG: MFS transporter [Oscillospiraceae bacterium]|nr:MFS transporter [Oscillospiraceae bacterium]
MKKNQEFRIIPVIACLITMLCVGIEYMWSVFQNPVMVHYGWAESSVRMVSSAMIMMFVVGIFVGGLIIDKMGPRLVVMIAGILFFAGLMLTSMLTADKPWLIYITYGVIAGTGVGFAYSGAINCVQKWLPHRRGFASGICVCAFGLSIVVFSPIAEYLLDIGVPFTFRTFAIVLGAIVFAMSFFFKVPDKGYAERLGVKGIQEKDSYTIPEAVRDPRFWFMCSALFFLPAPNMIIQPLVKTLAALRDVPAGQASRTVQLVGVASALSRLILPTLSDKLSRSKIIFAMTIVMMVSSLLMTFAGGYLYSAMIFLIVFAYSGPAGIYPAMTGEAYGMKNMGSIFGLAFLSIGLSTFAFNWLSTLINAEAAVTGDYTLIFIVGAVANIIPFVCMLMYDRVGKKKSAQRAALRGVD